MAVISGAADIPMYQRKIEEKRKKAKLGVDFSGNVWYSKQAVAAGEKRPAGFGKKESRKPVDISMIL